MYEIELTGLGLGLSILLSALGILFICDRIADGIVYWILKRKLKRD